MKQPIKMTPGDDLHLSLLMAPHNLNLAVGQFRDQLLGYGRAAFEAGKAGQCLHQIQEPAPVTAMDALREAEAALEVAMARILKADPGHSICVTSEAKALVAVRAALAATPTAAPVVLPEPDYSEFEQQLPIQPIGVMGGGEARKVLWNCTFMPEAGTSFYTEQQVRALLATGGQAQADCERCKGSGEDPEGYYDQSRGPDGDTHEGPCRTCNGTGAAPQAQADARDAELLDFIDSHAEGVIRLDAVPNYLHWGKHWEHKTARAAIAAAKGEA